MRYLLLFYLPDRPDPGTPEGDAFFAEMADYHRECGERGALVAAEPLHSPDAATTVRVRDGETLLIDGPFAESAEWLGGYFVVDTPGLDEALELAALCPTARTGSVEVRPIMEVAG
jgi:hypothetical protein